jgi:uncharacterized lipoprotein YmbA
MTYKHLFQSTVVLFVAFLPLLMGCAIGGSSSKSPTFYHLHALPHPGAVSQDQNGVAIEVGPVTIPAYLDRNQIAIIQSHRELYLDQFSRWDEPLKDSFLRILSENLSILLGTANVYAYPQRRGPRVDFQVEISVSRFLADDAGTAMLVALWSILDGDSQSVLLRKRSAFAKQADSREISAIVAAQNSVLEDFSREIAEEIGKRR